MMKKSRASIFEANDDIDISGFAPKPAAAPAGPPVEKVRAVSESANFRSREAPASKLSANTKRPPRRYRTGRNVQFNVKASQETVEAFYAVTDANPGWVLGYTLQRAIEALQRELKSPT